MIKVLFVSAALVIVIMLLTQQKADKADDSKAKATPIVLDYPSPTPVAVETTTQELTEPTQEATPEPARPKGLASLKLIGTIYGDSAPLAMLADANGKTFNVRLNQNILKSNFKVIEIKKDLIVLERDNKKYVIKMEKK